MKGEGMNDGWILLLDGINKCPLWLKILPLIPLFIGIFCGIGFIIILIKDFWRL